MKQNTWKLAIAALVVAGMVAPAFAGITVYEKGDNKLKLGGRVQIQYKRVDPDEGQATDDIFFRRLRFYLEGTVIPMWTGKIQVDFGKAKDDNEVVIKDAWMQYHGFKNLKITIGNSKSVFSREFLASSKKQELIERSFSGDHNYGAPDRQLGVRLDGHTKSKNFAYKLTLGAENHDPDAKKLDFDSPANNDSDWNQGWQASGRVDFFPLGAYKYDQGDFHSDGIKVMVGAGAFTWSNDDDNNTYTDAGGSSLSATKADLDSADGYELTAGIRGNGISFDADYHTISADTVDPAFTGGVYRNGTTDLDILALEGGYMLPGNRVELVAGYDSQDADNYEDSWDRTSVGVNYFWNKYNAKVQFTYQMNSNVHGASGVDEDVVYAQAQFVF